MARRGLFTFAVSGGATPWEMLAELATRAAGEVPWPLVHLFQVDERVAPAGHPDRNLARLEGILAGRVPLPPENLHRMPVEAADLVAAAAGYGRTLEGACGKPPVLDLVHLGLGADGHTASLVPGDAVLRVDDADVGLSGPYLGRRRMTLTFPALDRARRILWLVTGREKAPMLGRLLRGDPSIPAGSVRSDNALVLADRAAAAGGD